jgi:hypothetical protein
MTAGLANCIAVVAFNYNSMAMAHFDTAFCWDQPNHCFNLNTLLNWRLWLTTRTGFTLFKVGLGAVWNNTANKLAINDSQRFDLINKITYVFRAEPLIAGACIRFGTGLGFQPRLEESYVDIWMESANWKDEGHQIPYFELMG